MTVNQDSRTDDTDDAEFYAEDGPAEPPNKQPTRRPVKIVMHLKSTSWRAINALLARWRVIGLAVTTVAAAAITGALLSFQYRPDQQTDDAAAQASIKAATEGTAALLSYTPETVDNELAFAKSHLTGPYLQYVNDFTKYFLAPAVRQQNVKASASVIRAAVTKLQPDLAVVLEFVHQTTTSKEKPEPLLTTTNVRVTLKKVKGTWLISKFEPE